MGSVIGCVVLWRWELTGGVMNMAGIAAFYAVHYASVGSGPAGLALPALAVPGLLAIASYSLRLKAGRSSLAVPG